MQKFPRTTVGGVSLSRMIIGTNWFMGYSHTTDAKDKYIDEHLKKPKVMADTLAVFMKAGVDTIMGQVQSPPLHEAIQEAQQRTGQKMIIVSTPGYPIKADTPEKGFSQSDLDKISEEQAKLGATFCMPHQSTTDALLDRCSRKIRWMDQISAATRRHGMVPGLSTHMPESVTYADESGIDVETYIQIYNSMGFLMQIEVDWIQRVILGAKKPVMTIKPFAAGQIRPLQGLTFVWNSIRPIDMVTVGTMSPREAEEVIEMSMGILERRSINLNLQETRSKASVKPMSRK
jgi:hypothetical protein